MSRRLDCSFYLAQPAELTLLTLHNPNLIPRSQKPDNVESRLQLARLAQVVLYTAIPFLPIPLTHHQHPTMPSDPTLYLYTSLTAGSSHIITATSRIETILKANKIPFKAVDCATDDKARMLWQRRSKGRKIPGLVKFNDVIAVCVRPSSENLRSRFKA